MAPVRGEAKLGSSGGTSRGGPGRSATANHIQLAAAVQYCSRWRAVRWRPIDPRMTEAMTGEDTLPSGNKFHVT
jgi:hypothetical protein